MKKSKAISLLLSLSLLATAIVPGGMTMQAYAALENQAAEEPGDQNEGMKISKKAEKNADGSYTITLEAYATGKKVITESKKDVPTDIVLVLDQSGSMANEDFPSVGETTYVPYTGREARNSNLYSKRHNNDNWWETKNLYYELDDGGYATVSVVRELRASASDYKECPKNWENNAKGSWGNFDPDDYWKYKNNLFVKVDEEYKKVKLDRKDTDNSMFGTHYVYSYRFPNGTTIESEGDNGQPGYDAFQGNGPLYYLENGVGEYTYTYTCTDTAGNTINIGTSTGEDTQFTNPPLYRQNVAQGGNITRLDALKNAVTGFKNSVAQKAAGKDGILGTDDDVDHRIAVVGFASGERWNNTNYHYGNTEVFIGSDQYTYGTDAQNQYANAFQSMKTEQGQTNVNASINALSADGGTLTNLGLEMANGILNANPVPEGQKRNRVVIVFTDGVPGWSKFDTDTAGKAIDQADAARTNGADVYSVGIFEGADATSAGNQDGNNDTQKANWFMQNLSDNLGVPQTPSYYLSAADSNTLNNIFQQISDNIESGGSSTTLGKETVIKDLVSNYFQLPAGTTKENITVQTVPCTGITNDVPSWGKPENFTDAQVTVNAVTGEVQVSGFDFAANYVGMDKLNGVETLHDPAKKLVISFNVEPKEDFLGGNGVPTNGGAYIYENKDATDPVLEFDKPMVDVPIKDITVTAEDKNVYLLGDLTGDQIKAGATVNVGNVALKLGDNNFGLQSWQNEYVNIEVTYQDKDGQSVTNLEKLTDDQEYKVIVTVTPKEPTGTAKKKTDNATGKINVFKPELTYKDSSVYYGDTAPTDYRGNLVSTKWFHNETDAGTVKMTGSAQVLDVTYTPEANKIVDGKINTKNDIPVKAEVQILGTDVNQYVTFKHEACKPACGWNKTTLDGDPAFLLHVDTCQLTITKTGGAAGEPYVFTILKDGNEYSEVTIVGNSSETIYELPVGNYTIQEDKGWSWRYDGVIGDAVELSSTNTKGEITCTNTKNNNYWLNGFSEVVKNIFDVSHTN